MGQSVHVIPVVVEVHGAQTRHEAYEIVREGFSILDSEDFEAEVRIGYPNDDWNGHWHLAWVPGPPPEDLDDITTYNPEKGLT